MMNLKLATTLLLLMQLIQFSGCGKLEELTSGEEATSTSANGGRTTSSNPNGYNNNANADCSSVKGEYSVLKINNGYMKSVDHDSGEVEYVDAFSGYHGGDIFIWETCSISFGDDNKGDITEFNTSSQNKTVTMNVYNEPRDERPERFRMGKYNCTLTYLGGIQKEIELLCDEKKYNIISLEALQKLQQDYWNSFYNSQNNSEQNNNDSTENSDFELVSSNIETTDIGLLMSSKCSLDKHSYDTSSTDGGYNQMNECLYRVNESGEYSEVEFSIKNKSNNQTNTQSLRISDIHYIKKYQTIYIQIPIGNYYSCISQHILFTKNMDTGEERFYSAPFSPGTNGDGTFLDSYHYTPTSILAVAVDNSDCDVSSIYKINTNTDSGFSNIFNNSSEDKFYANRLEEVSFNTSYYYSLSNEKRLSGLRLGDTRTGVLQLDGKIIASPKSWHNAMGGNTSGNLLYAISELDNLGSFSFKYTDMFSVGTTSNGKFFINSQGELFSLETHENVIDYADENPVENYIIKILKWNILGPLDTFTSSEISAASYPMTSAHDFLSYFNNDQHIKAYNIGYGNKPSFQYTLFDTDRVFIGEDGYIKTSENISNGNIEIEVVENNFTNLTGYHANQFYTDPKTTNNSIFALDWNSWKILKKQNLSNNSAAEIVFESNELITQFYPLNDQFVIIRAKEIGGNTPELFILNNGTKQSVFNFDVYYKVIGFEY